MKRLIKRNAAQMQTSEKEVSTLKYITGLITVPNCNIKYLACSNCSLLMKYAEMQKKA